MLETGDSVERYTVDRLLGEGGMADVYRVKHRTLGTPAALKVLRVNARYVQERLVQEGQVQAALKHPNIVEVRDVLEVAGFPALLLELVEGPSLEALLIQGRLPFEEAEEIFRGILAAVEHAHAGGLVHRDLKPGNVLLAPKPGGGWIPKVADFGLARLMEADDAGMRKTRSGMAMGTPRYMSPEQIRDAKNVDQRTDIFAMGAILYELVCGEAAFERPDIAAIFNATLSGSYKSPQSLAPGVPERVLRAIDASLKTRKEVRIPNCGTFRAVLDGAAFTPDARAVAEGPALVIPKAPRTIVSADTMDLASPAAKSSRSSSPSMIGAAVVGGGVVAGGLVVAALLLIGAGWWFFGRGAPTESGSPTPVEATSSPGDTVIATPDIAPSGAAPTPTVERETTATPAPAKPPVDASVAEPSPVVSTRPVKSETPAPAKSAPDKPVVVPVETPAEAPVVVTKPVAPKITPPKAISPAETVTENAAVGARISFSGDASKVWLVSAGTRRVARGIVPEGRYDIEADFGDGARTPAGEIDLEVGDEVALKCSKTFKRCKK